MLVFIINMRIEYFKRVYSIVDLSYVIINLTIFVTMGKRKNRNIEEEQFEESVKQERIFEVLAILTLYSKASYFLSLVD